MLNHKELKHGILLDKNPQVDDNKYSISNHHRQQQISEAFNKMAEMIINQIHKRSQPDLA